MIFALNSSGWASRWSLDQLILHAYDVGLFGIELQMGTSHGVTTELDDEQREAVAAKLADAPLDLLGLATSLRLDHPNTDANEAAASELRDIMRLSHDIGGFGVHCKAAQLPDTDRSRAIERIATAVRELSRFGLGWGQQVRLELGGACAEPETATALFRAIDDANVTLCWASNPANLSPQGLEHDLKSLLPRLGETVYVGPLDEDIYPYHQLLTLLTEADYHHWVILRTEGQAPANIADVLGQQHRLFQRITDTAPGFETQLQRRRETP